MSQRSNWSLNILLAESEPAVRKLLTTVLSQAGCEVIDATPSTQILPVASRLTCVLDLVIFDAEMPFTAACATLAELRRLKPEAPVLVMSEDPQLMKTLGASCVYLEKPFLPSKLLDVIGHMRMIPQAGCRG